MRYTESAQAYLRALVDGASIEAAALDHIDNPGAADSLADFLERAADHLRQVWRLGKVRHD